MAPDVSVTVLCRSCIAKHERARGSGGDGAFNLVVDDSKLEQIGTCPRCGAKDVAVIATAPPS